MSSPIQATVLCAHGQTDTVELPAGETARLLKLKLLVGDTLEVVPLTDQRLMVLHGEAKNQPHFVNATATLLAREAQSIPPDDYIAGTAVIVPRTALC